MERSCVLHPRCGGRLVGGRQGGCTESIGNAIDDAFDVLVDLGHPESQHAKAQLAQPAISPRVIDKLIAVVVAIDFDHQPRLQAGEVREVGPDRNLASELVSQQLPASQAVPEPPFVPDISRRSSCAR